MLSRTFRCRISYLAVTSALLASNILSACISPFPATPVATLVPTPTPEPTPIPASYYVEQGDGAVLKGDWGAAETAYRTAIQMDSDGAPAYSRLAFLLSLQQRFESESLDLAQKATEIAPDDPEAWAFLSLVSVADYDYDQLPTAAQKAVKLGDKNALAHTALAQARLTLNEVEEAKSEVERALELDPQNVLALTIQAAYYSRQGEFDQALLCAEKAVALQPNFVYARLTLAQAHMDILEYKEAQDQLEAALKVNPEYLPAMLALARLYAVDGGQRSKAWEVMHRAEELKPQVPAVFVMQGWLYLQAGAYDQALSRFQEALAQDKSFWPALLEQGQTYYVKNQCPKAVESFRGVVDSVPTLGRGHLWLALSLECMGEGQRAEEGYRKALELSPNDPEVLMSVGGHLLKTGDYKLAMDDYRKAIVQRLYDPDTYVRLGYAYVYNPTGQNAAESNFQQALALKKEDFWALVGMGKFYNNQQEYQKAIETFTKAQYIYPKTYDIHYGLGVAFVMQGEYRQAISHLEQAWELNPKEPMTLLYLARAYRKVKDYKKTAWAYEEFLKSNTQVLSRGYMRGVISDLSNGQYEFPERQVLYVLKEIWQSYWKPSLKDQLTLSLVSASVERVDGERTLKMVLEVQDDKYDDKALSTGIATALEHGAALAPRIQPPPEGGVEVLMRDAKKQDLAEARVSLLTAQDMIDGLIPDTKALLQQISLRDLRRWKTDLSPEQALAAIGKDVEEDRDLSAKRQVQFRFITRAELRTWLQTEYEKQSKEKRRALEDMLILFGWPKSGAEPAFEVDEQASQLDGLYVPKEDVFYIVSEEKSMNVQNELTFAHEYVHALQDQYRDLSALENDETGSYDQQMAFRAIIEGEATQVTLKYFEKHLTPLEQMMAMQGDRSSQGAAAKQVSLFPYLGGFDFIEAVAQGGYWPAIEDVYKNPPTSTEQILHPDKYKGKRDDPQTVTLPQTLSQLKGDWQETYSNVMGEYFIGSYLAQHVSFDLASVAAAGWDGDRFVLLENRQDGRDLVIGKIAWDSTEEARQFVTAHRLAFGYGGQYTEALRELKGGDRTLRWESGQRCIYLRQKGDTTWLILASRPEDLDVAIPLLKEE